jgi:integrator complex subunit 11
MPGYCVQGTVGHKILSGAKKIEFENRQVIDVKMAVEYMSFSAHADAKGIMQLIKNCEPRNVMLVHGEAVKMEFLKEKIREEFEIDCYSPANGETCIIKTPIRIPVECSLQLLKNEAKIYNAQPPDPKRRRFVHGILAMKEGKLVLMDLPEVWKEFNGLNHFVMKYSSIIKLDSVVPTLQILEQIHAILKEKLMAWTVKLIDGQSLGVETVVVKVDTESHDKKICVSWEGHDEDLGRYVIGLLQTLG